MENIESDLGEIGGNGMNGLIWLRIGTGGGILLSICTNGGFSKRDTARRIR
jgi:hypothetical protein